MWRFEHPLHSCICSYFSQMLKKTKGEKKAKTRKRTETTSLFVQVNQSFVWKTQLSVPCLVISNTELPDFLQYKAILSSSGG